MKQGQQEVDNLTDTVASIDLAKEPAQEEDEDQLPPELKNLIEATVKEGTPEVELNQEVTVDVLLQFFEEAVKLIEKDETLTSLQTAVTPDMERDTKLGKIKEVLNPIYEKLWNKFGVPYELGKHAISTHQQILQNEDIDVEVKAKLMENIRAFSSTEQRLVKRTLMGEEGYQKQQEEEVKVDEVKQDLMKQLQGLDPMGQGRLILQIKEEGAALRERLGAMKQEDAIKYIQNPSSDDQMLLYKLGALSMIIGSSQHGHTHNGQPCGGHGHAQEAAHGHTHDGKPCGGHGHSQEISHGHTHDGKPCGGHGHAQEDHGHSHETHGHSHNGKPCGGHGHSH